MGNQHHIQIGIDLGTTNSSVAINQDGKIEIVKKPGGVEYTPSVFGFDKSKHRVVGQKAYEAFYRDASEDEIANYKPEVKRIMGTSETFTFTRGKVKMNAEEISAEILKCLKEDVIRKYPTFNTRAAVITIPAAFSTLQSEATKRAGNLAGFEHVVLLQEPIAAAMAYGFGNTSNENWLVYDLGGGTFDVALIASKDGILSVLSHNGDNYLGGKNIDLDIVDKVIVPRLLKTFALKEFDRSNEKYRSAFAKLKYIAETAKIYLSQYETMTIEIEDLDVDDEGNSISLSFEYSRKEFEKLIHPLVDRTVALAKATLKDAGVKNAQVNKIILVGGPTLIPAIRFRLEKDLGIAVDSSVDPLTVVAKGACVFAIGQKLPSAVSERDEKAKPGAKLLKLNHETLTCESETMVTGLIDELSSTRQEYFIQIQSESGHYSSAKIPLKSGRFIDTVAIEQGKENIFWIYLFDDKGGSIPVSPDSFSVTQGLSVSGSPLPHSIGIVVAKKDFHSSFVQTEVFEKLIEKGSILPQKSKAELFKTTRPLRKGDNENPLWIKILEGESDIPDRNAYVCELGIRGEELPHDLPVGSDIEIELSVNESREVYLTAYIPIIDKTLNARSTVRDEAIDVKAMEAELTAQRERMQSMEEHCSNRDKEDVDGMISSTFASLKNAGYDEDEKRRASKLIRDLKTRLDDMEKANAMPQLIEQFRGKVDEVEKLIEEYADQKEKPANQQRLAAIKAEGEAAIAAGDKTLLIRVNEQLRDLGGKAFFSNPATWVYYFEKMTSEEHDYRNKDEAQYYIAKGKKAVQQQDLEELKRCVRCLVELLPTDEQNVIQSKLSGIMRAMA